jgi:4-carboxymuconolactone decarboxylase
MESEKMKIGRQNMNKLAEGADVNLMKRLGKSAPDLARGVLEFVFGDIYERPGLELKTKQILTITILATLGNAKPQLAFHIKAGLNLGITRDEIVGIMTHLSAYAGFPAAMNGIATANEVFDELDKAAI